jgi:hypothetical protein
MSTQSLNTAVNEQQCFCAQKVAKNLVTFWAQIVAIYIVILTSVINLSLSSPHQELWLILLSSCLGYILPNPGVKYKTMTSNDDIERRLV